MWSRLWSGSADESSVDLKSSTAQQPRETQVEKLSWMSDDVWLNRLDSSISGRTTLHPSILHLPRRERTRPRTPTPWFHPSPPLPSPALRAHTLTTTREKCYDPQDHTLTFVDREDELDFLCEGFKSRRALMSCGHAVTPTSLTNWCRRQLDEGESRFVCGQSGCNVQWPYSEVCKMALLTPEEMQYFKQTLASNAARRHFPTKLCPGCKSPVVRKNPSNLRVRCTVCPTNKGRTFKFCWQCLREWKGPAPRSDRCENHGCCNESLKTLETCPDAVFESVEGVTGCPSIRACPTCGILLQHDNTQCKNVVCPRCKVEFCFVCLKLTVECSLTTEEYLGCSSGVAPRQTSIPVWR